MPLNRIFAVFKTHLDVGFTSFASRVRQRYLDEFIPRAVATADKLKQGNPDISFTWTTGSWLIYEALESLKGKRLREMERAIDNGHIAWHGLPFTTHTELMDASLFRFGLSLSRKLDARFGKKTMAAKMTDVPGHTRSIIPLLAEKGIRFLHIGVNPAATPPTVPDAFRWRHPSGSEVVVLYEKNDYGGVVTIPGMTDALAMVHTGDNQGPPSVDAVVSAFNDLKSRFPGMKIVSGRLDAFGRSILRIRNSLPVVSTEIGDTWIHGAGTDPKKVAVFRELQRLRAGWEQSGAKQEPLERFSRHLLMVPEHTWGMDEKTHLGDYTHYTGTGFRAMKRTDRCRRFEKSWHEQRDYLKQAVRKLKNQRLRTEAQMAVRALNPKRPSGKGFRKIVDPGMAFKAENASLRFDPVTGAVIHLTVADRKGSLAGPNSPLGLFGYEQFTDADYKRFGKQYLRRWPNAADWAVKDFTKPGLERLRLRHRYSYPVLKEMRHRIDDKGNNAWLLSLGMPKGKDSLPGMPREIFLEVILPTAGNNLKFVLQWFNKPACRLPEASWLSFNPRVGPVSDWSLVKMGSTVSPFDVVRNGNRKLHAVEAVRHDGRSGNLEIISKDAPLVAPGQPSLLDFNNRQPALRKGIHFNLHNNVWGTNFPMWYGEDARFRFAVKWD